jgi:hypothetical protein
MRNAEVFTSLSDIGHSVSDIKSTLITLGYLLKSVRLLVSIKIYSEPELLIELKNFQNF